MIIGLLLVYQTVMFSKNYLFLKSYFNHNLISGSNILRIAKETTPSSYKEGRIDTPIHASLFLKRFSILNMKLLKSLDVI